MLNGTIYGFYFDKQGFIHTKRFVNGEEQFNGQETLQYSRVIRREPATWLKFIVIFWSPRVLKAAVKFGLAAMIMNKYERGWDVGVAGTKVGGKRRITCPPAMAYGQKGSPPTITPNSTLVFEVELKGLY